MFGKTLQKLGLLFSVSKAPDSLQPLWDQLAPRDLGLEVVTIGDQSHQHRFRRVSWDRERFGSDCTDSDLDRPDGLVAFSMATYKDLLRCGCGAEAVKSVRALI